MTDKINHVEKLERITEQLADSVLELSDEAILAEIIESGADPREEAERIRLVLQQASKSVEAVIGSPRITTRHVGRTVR
jgi:hypothetical protein